MNKPTLKIRLTNPREDGAEQWWGHGGFEHWLDVASLPNGREMREVVLMGRVAEYWLGRASEIPGWESAPVKVEVL